MSEAHGSSIPEELKYSDQHEWIAMDGEVGTIGITDYAQGELGDIVFVELPEVGDRLEQGQAFGTVEAVKTVEDLFTPVAGRVVEINDTLEERADQVNKEPYGSGWMVKLTLDDLDELEGLLAADAYAELLADG